MNYHRIIPRDFFNEANLLKCLGKFELAVNHEGKLPKVQTELESCEDGFKIRQNQNTGYFYCENYRAWIGDDAIDLYVPLNSREPWPLYAVYKDEEYSVFDKNGNVMPNFGVDQSVK